MMSDRLVDICTNSIARAYPQLVHCSLRLNYHLTRHQSITRNVIMSIFAVAHITNGSNIRTTLRHMNEWTMVQIGTLTRRDTRKDRTSVKVPLGGLPQSDLL